MYLPESKVPAKGTVGVADDRSTWLEWRVDPHTGEQWYRRTSEVVSVDDRPEIQGIDNCEPNDEKIDTLDELDEEDRKRQLMFRKHKLRAETNPYSVPQEEPSDDE
jgi:hypothetical protein